MQCVHSTLFKILQLISMEKFKINFEYKFYLHRNHVIPINLTKQIFIFV